MVRPCWQFHCPLCSLQYYDMVLCQIVYATRFLYPYQKVTKSLNYRPISLSSTLSQVLERLLLSVYDEFLSSSHLQFGFKRGFSTSLCTATIKNIVTNYLHRDSSVLGCFLDGSKAFDLVDHGILFKILLERGLPLSIVRFLISWYSMQQLRVRWNSPLSDPF